MDINAIVNRVVKAVLADRSASTPIPDMDTLLADVEELKRPAGLLKRLPKEGQELLSLIEADLHKLSRSPRESKRVQVAWSNAMLLLERTLNSMYRKEYWEAKNLQHMAQEYIAQLEQEPVAA